jgi:hypothetical protein
MTAAEPTAEALARSLGAKRNGRGWLSRCPAHHDRDPSLSIEERSGRAVFVCRSGCDQKAVVDALRRRGLWPEPDKDEGAKCRIIATYPYRDETGELRYQVVRFQPKDFRQRRPNGAPDRWEWNMTGVEPLPYRLPELVADPVATVFIVEGEKDADNLAEIGILATCNHGGAGKWRREISRWFGERNVVIIPDNDEPGRAHARDVAAKLLAGIAASVRILELPGLPPKGDVSDWLAAGGDAETLDRLVSAADPLLDANPAQALPLLPGPIDAGEDDAPIPPRGWLLGNTFCRSFISGLLSQGAAGKTAVRIAQALALATGRPLTGEHVFLRCRVLIVCLEDSLDELRRRVRAARLHHGVTADELRGWFIYWAPAGLKIAEQRDGSHTVAPGDLEQQLRAFIAQRNIDLVILDPLVKTHAVEENDNSAIDAVACILARLADDLNCAVDILHHERKAGSPEADDANRGRGASSFRDAARLLHTVTPMTAAERDQFGLAEADRRSLIRVDGAKLNIAPPSIEAQWFKIVGVPLGNATELYSHGDTVPTVEPWQPPDLWRELPIATVNAILDQIERGPAEGRRYSPAIQAEDRVAWPVVHGHCPTFTEKECQIVISTWLKTGMLEGRDYDDPILRKKTQRPVRDQAARMKCASLIPTLAQTGAKPRAPVSLASLSTRERERLAHFARQSSSRRSTQTVATGRDWRTGARLCNRAGSAP